MVLFWYWLRVLELVLLLALGLLLPWTLLLSLVLSCTGSNTGFGTSAGSGVGSGAGSAPSPGGQAGHKELKPFCSNVSVMASAGSTSPGAEPDVRHLTSPPPVPEPLGFGQVINTCCAA